MFLHWLQLSVLSLRIFHVIAILQIISFLIEAMPVPRTTASSMTDGSVVPHILTSTDASLDELKTAMQSHQERLGELIGIFNAMHKSIAKIHPNPTRSADYAALFTQSKTVPLSLLLYI